MFPIKDNIPNERFPFVTVALVCMTAVAYLLSVRPGGLLPLLLDILLLALLGPSVEGALGRTRFCALCLLGCLVALAIRSLVGAGVPSLALFGASGAIAAVLLAYFPLHPRGRVLTLILIPFFVTIVEIPAVLLLGLWVAAQLYFGAVGPA
jgi:membrane associated rhomboid family serine protease